MTIKWLQYALTLFVAVLFSCSKNKDPDPANQLITIDARSYTFQNGETDWFFINDENGKVVVMDKISTAGMLSLSGTTFSDTITVTRMITSGNPGHIVLTSFGGVPKHATFRLGQDDFSVGPKSTGNCSIHVTNFPFNVNNSVLSASFPGFAGQYLSQGDEVTFTQPLFADTTSIYLTAYSADTLPMYVKLNKVKVSDSPAVDFNDFKPLPGLLSIPGDHFSYASLTGNNTETESDEIFFTNYSQNSHRGLRVPKLGYLPGYKTYRTFAAIVDENGQSTSYQKKGSIPSSAILPAFTASALDLNFASQHKFIIDRNWTYADVHYTVFVSTPVNQLIDWYIIGPKEHRTTFSEIPAGLVAQYPVLDFGNFLIADVAFTERLDGYTYTQLIADTFSGNTKFDSYEYLRFVTN